MRHRLTATRCLLARLAARRTLGRARVTPLNALGLQNSCLRRPLSSHGASEHLKHNFALLMGMLWVVCACPVVRAVFPGASRRRTSA